MVLAAMLCSVVLLTLGLLVSMAVMAWYFYSPVELVAGPGCSRLVRANPLFVKEITVRMVEGGQGSGENGLVLYGHAGGPPRLDVPAAWSEARRVVVPANSHREWVYFLNRGSQIQVDYSVEPETAPPSNRLCVVVAQGKESFMQWSEKPSSVHGTTFSRRLVHGTGTVRRTIDSSQEYYVAVGNMNDRDTTLRATQQAALAVLRLKISRALLAGDAGCQSECRALRHDGSRLRLLAGRGKLPLHVRTADPRTECGRPVVRPQRGVKMNIPTFSQVAATVLTNTHATSLQRSGSESDDDEQHAKVVLSYEPRLIVYFVGSAILAVVLYEVLATMLGCCCCSSTGDGAAEQRTTTASLLAADKEEEDASLGSSYDSVSSDGDHDEEAGGDEEEGRRLCVVCCDARRDCFFLPCGHSATCHPCGTRIVEGDGGSCPFCRRKLKKVRRIFAV